jgi:transposase
MASERKEVLIMGDPVAPERPGERSAVAQGHAEIPAMPVILPSEQVPGAPYPLLDGISPALGWEFRSSARGGPAFVIVRRTGLGSLKVVESFPLTEDGWARAWQSLARQNPAAVPQILATLGALEDLRDYTRARTRLVQERTRCWQRLEKLLEGALVKVSSVASKLTTVSAQDMIKAMIAGERNPEVLAGLARGRMKAKHDDLVEALDGMFDDHHGELAGLLLDQIAFLGQRITELTIRITAAVTAMPAVWGVDGDGTTGPDAGTGPDAAVMPAVTRLAEIPGISPDVARTVIAETGLDMSRFPTAAHLVSWAGLCPSARQSGPRARPGKKGQGDTWLRGALGQAATAAAGTATFLGERYARIARRRGKAKAQVAVARSILVIIWHLLADPAARFTDLGHDYYQARTDKDKKIKNHIRQIEALLGHPITITPKAA